MFTGDIQLADIRIKWFGCEETNKVDVIIWQQRLDDTGFDKEVIEGVNMRNFYKALSIALHFDGMPDYRVDYTDAESVMGKIRWIP